MEAVSTKQSVFGKLRDENMQHFQTGTFRLFIAP